MTVLVVAGSKDGVAIGADGKRVSRPDGKTVLDAQKVWEGKTLQQDSVLLGLCGHSTIKRTCTFSFEQTLNVVLGFLDLSDYDESHADFVSAIGSGVLSHLAQFMEGYTDESSPTPLPKEIAKVAIAWNSNGHPIFAAIAFEHEQANVACYMNHLYDDVDDLFCPVSGSPTIDKRTNPRISSLTDAAEACRCFAQDCVDNRDVLPDCADYGGWVHVGAITASGFTWIVPPTGVQ